jgi:hypothetical protein
VIVVIGDANGFLRSHVSHRTTGRGILQAIFEPWYWYVDGVTQTADAAAIIRHRTRQEELARRQPVAAGNSRLYKALMTGFRKHTVC